MTVSLIGFVSHFIAVMFIGMASRADLSIILDQTTPLI